MSKGAILKFKKISSLERELAIVEKAEERIRKEALRSKKASWKTELENKIPQKAYAGLKTAFGKAFAIVFEKGTGVIEKTFDKDAMAADYEIHDYAVRRKGGRKEIRSLQKEALKTDFANMAVTAAEGIGLGIFGIGLCDIVLFVGMLLKGIYQTALNYGVDYTVPREKYSILKMMEAAMAKGEEFVRLEEELAVEQERDMLWEPSKEQFDKQLMKTADAFAADMLLLKFVQGLPVVGVLGGVGNPVCYRKVMRYAGIKYRKRYLLQCVLRVKKDGGT